MFNIGFSEMMIIAVIALIFIGPKQLPELARTLGRLIGEFKKATEDLTGTFTGVRDSAEKYVQETSKSIQDAIRDNQSYQDLIKPEGTPDPHAHLHNAHGAPTPLHGPDVVPPQDGDQLELTLSEEKAPPEAEVPETAASPLKPGGRGSA